MSIKVAKVALSNREVRFVELCSNVFQAFGLDGLIDLARNTPCTNERDEVFFALAQSVYVSLEDSRECGRPEFSLLGLYRLFSADFRDRSHGEQPNCIDVTDWYNESKDSRIEFVRHYFWARALDGLKCLGDQVDNSIARSQRTYYNDLAHAADVFRV